MRIAIKPHRLKGYVIRTMVTMLCVMNFTSSTLVACRERDMKRFNPVQVLIERKQDGYYTGYTNQYHSCKILSDTPLSGRIQELEKIMENVHIIEKGETDKVSLGTTVKIKYVDDDEIEEYRIVGSKEADPSNNKISNESPIAKAIMNGKVGEIKKVASPNGEYEVEIVAIC